MTGYKTLQFSLGPVQSFVAQARRTRDFWAGSFLLSYLAGQAMQAVLAAKGEIVVPSVYGENGNLDPLLAAIAADRCGQPVLKGPAYGSLPNRFRARVPVGFDPTGCVQAVQEAWQRIAVAVWERFVAPVAGLGNDTPGIWREQVEGFWEMTWVIGDFPALLDQRKNWRSHVPPRGNGEMCTIAGTLQEISGFTRSLHRKEQQRFWDALRQGVPALDLEEGERLSAIALIKRLFPRVARTAFGWEEVPTAFPSTTYLAAVHWMEAAMRDKPGLTKELVAIAEELDAFTSRGMRICCLEEVRVAGAVDRLADLDGSCFFKATLDNDRQWAKGTGKTRLALRELLGKFREQPTPYYGLLLMDGDRMGALIQDHDPQVVSSALNRFSYRVPGLVERYNGMVAYAGGDDVLALFPMEDALPAAVELCREYRLTFAAKVPAIPEKQATISAAIVYAHHRAPLKLVLENAHKILEEKAKEEGGRDSLAVTVWKGGGPVLTWTTPWEVIIGSTSQPKVPDLIQQLVLEFGGESKKVSHSFFYNLRSRYAVLNGRNGGAMEGSDLTPLLTAEYLKNREVPRERAAVEDLVRRLLEICLPSWRDEAGEVRHSPGVLGLEGAFLVQFLSSKGVER